MKRLGLLAGLTGKSGIHQVEPVADELHNRFDDGFSFVAYGTDISPRAGLAGAIDLPENSRVKTNMLYLREWPQADTPVNFIPLLGMALIMHVFERCKLYADFSDVIVATCDEEIRHVVEERGGTVVMTANTHDRATDRVQEAVETLYPKSDDHETIVMVQGDELLVSPEMIDKVIETQRLTGSAVVNFGSRLNPSDHENPNTVKLVAAPDGRVLYFSRAPIPSETGGRNIPIYQQTIDGFYCGFLRKFSVAQTPLEIIEFVDMLRVLSMVSPFMLFYMTSRPLVSTHQRTARGGDCLRWTPLRKIISVIFDHYDPEGWYCWLRRCWQTAKIFY